MGDDFLGMLAEHGCDAETVAFECLVNGLTDARTASLMHVLGWPDDARCFAVAGYADDACGVSATLLRLRAAVRDLGGSLTIAGQHDGVCVALTAAQAAATPEVTCTAMMPAFADDRPVALGPVRHGVDGASATVLAALSTLAAAPAVRFAGGAAQPAPVPRNPRSDALRLIRAEDALPERALIGDADAKRELVEAVYGSLTAAGPDDPTLETVSTFLMSGGSLETTAKALNVHPNTVRYRLKRAADATGWDATDPREAYVLRTAIALGRIAR
ncbi:helix-turn-helix domain-containing protein [Bifidobacterium amazonense]|uniref:Helix-turn-helix domain-containing protein n=1 Tax=Bifidobacterium amazonense TaxID=2809027 RepID=A0ABS9VYS2_9BIFI|nr:helix-turn-helix domain-containing protein [Bifidobacterium amazonense]MCH9277086.1 helix-turn-helix domain-containing protein [Bifidobacterium amazonense]